MSETRELLKWVDSKRKPRFRPHLSQQQNEFVRKVGVQHAREVEAILLKHRSPKTLQNYRNSDPQTSKDAGAKISDRGMKRELLEAFSDAGDFGMTNYEAGIACDYLSRDPVPCYWKRVSELEVMGYIRTDGVRVNPATKMDQRVKVITEKGKAALS